MKVTVLFKAFVVIGIGFILASVFFQKRAAEFVGGAVEASGVVVALERKSRGSFSPVVEWTDHTGVSRTFYSPMASHPPRYFEGELVTVLFDPNDPKYPVNARIKSTLDSWGIAIFFAIFGGFWLLVTLLSWYVWSRGGTIVIGGRRIRGGSDDGAKS